MKNLLIAIIVTLVFSQVKCREFNISVGERNGNSCILRNSITVDVADEINFIFTSEGLNVYQTEGDSCNGTEGITSPNYPQGEENGTIFTHTVQDSEMGQDIHFAAGPNCSQCSHFFYFVRNSNSSGNNTVEPTGNSTTMEPTVTIEPTNTSSNQPTAEPTGNSTTLEPTETSEPTNTSSNQPTTEPTGNSTTLEPTETSEPTNTSSNQPTTEPTGNSTTMEPTGTVKPTHSHTSSKPSHSNEPTTECPTNEPTPPTTGANPPHSSSSVSFVPISLFSFCILFFVIG